MKKLRVLLTIPTLLAFLLIFAKPVHVPDYTGGKHFFVQTKPPINSYPLGAKRLRNENTKKNSQGAVVMSYSTKNKNIAVSVEPSIKQNVLPPILLAEKTPITLLNGVEIESYRQVDQDSIAMIEIDSGARAIQIYGETAKYGLIRITLK